MASSDEAGREARIDQDKRPMSRNGIRLVLGHRNKAGTHLLELEYKVRVEAMG